VVRGRAFNTGFCGQSTDIDAWYRVHSTAVLVNSWLRLDCGFFNLFSDSFDEITDYLFGLFDRT
jgi:hypothetical protein